MNTCGSCKFLGDEIVEETFPDGKLVEVRTGYFKCGLVKHENDFRAPVATPGANEAYVVDGSGYYAALCVSSEFGCVKWERKVVTEFTPAADDAAAPIGSTQVLG